MNVHRPFGQCGALSDKNGNYISGSLTLLRPFGDFRRTPSTNPDITDRGFTGHAHNNSGDNNLGLIYMRARFYLPEASRFVSADTLVPDPMNPQQFNRYTYALNSPLNFLDPSGHCASDPYDDYEDYACWQQYNYLVDYLTTRGYDFWEHLGGGSQWEYIPEVFDSQRIDALPSVHQGIYDSHELSKTDLRDFDIFSQGYHFYSIYFARSEIAFSHAFLNELHVPPRHNSPVSYIIAATYSEYVLHQAPFIPYQEQDFKIAYSTIKYSGNVSGAEDLRRIYNMTTNPVGASTSVDGFDKPGVMAPLTFAIDLQVDLTSDYINNENQ